MFCFHKRSYWELVTDSNVNTDASGKVPKISELFSQFKTLWQFLGILKTTQAVIGRFLWSTIFVSSVIYN